MNRSDLMALREALKELPCKEDTLEVLVPLGEMATIDWIIVELDRAKTQLELLRGDDRLRGTRAYRQVYYGEAKPHPLYPRGDGNVPD